MNRRQDLFTPTSIVHTDEKRYLRESELKSLKKVLDCLANDQRANALVTELLDADERAGLKRLDLFFKSA